MNKLLMTSTAIALIGVPAFAADVPVVEYVAPPAIPVYDWTGPYVGVHGGFGGDRFDYPWFFNGGFEDLEEQEEGEQVLLGLDGFLPVVITPEVEDGLFAYDGSFDITSSGFFAGGQAGFNWQVSPNFLVGIEADIAWSGIKGELGAGLGPWGLEAGSSVNWFGTVRGRAGFVNGPLLVYGTGGFAYGEVESYLRDDDGDGISASQSSHGWTAGGGVEFMVSPNVSVKTEYLYVDLGSQDLLGGVDLDEFIVLNGEGAGFFSGGLSSDTHFHTIKAGINLHLGEPNSQYAMPAPPTYDWNGFYVGAHGGYGGNKFDYPWFIDANWDDWATWLTTAAQQPPDGISEDDLLFLAGKVGAFDGSFNGSFDITSSGFFGGGQVGFNWQPGPNWLVGVEADIAWSGIKGELGIDLDDLGTARAGSKVDWFGTVRGRAGWIHGPLLLYGTGGFAYGGLEAYYDLDSFFTADDSQSWTATGWTAGGGFEYMINENLSFKTEYLYVDLGSHNLYSETYTEVPLGGESIPIPATTVGLDQNTSFHTVKAGVNVHF